MMDCDGWWLRTALHRLACLPPVRPGHTPLAALAPLSLGERGKGGAKPPGCPSKPLPTIALLGVGRIGGCSVGAGFKPAPTCVCLRGGAGIPCVRFAPRPLTLKRRGLMRLVGLPVVGEGGWEGVDDAGGLFLFRQGGRMVWDG